MFRLKEIRKEHKKSQEELAKLLGVTQATLSGWENEKYEIDNKSLIKCAEILNVSVDYLLGRSDEQFVTENIKKSRESAGLSQKQVSLELKVSAPTVCEWEKGKKHPTAENLKKLAKLYNVTTDYLLGLSDRRGMSSDNTSRSIAKTLKLKELRSQKKISQQKLADLLGVSRSAVSMWEIDASQPDLDTLLKLSDIFNISVDYLLGRTNDPESHIDKFSFLDERDRDLVATIIEKSYERSKNKTK